ncbi:MAG: 4-hydroxythreonine-4-phosphate dehydrogenase PdxA [Prevotella sp.]|nr:4-hydroxythreonine-4-phosphate dehydrogenase PdxA [Prevotella sp.]
MENKKLRVAITHGDTNGVGYEVIFKTFADPMMLELCTPIIYGSPKVATYHRNALGIQGNFTIISNAAEAHSGKLNLLTTFDEEVKVEFGQPSKEAGTAAYKALERAMEDYKQGLFDVLVTAPINKSNIQSADFTFCGHTEYIEDRIGEGEKALMILLNGNLRVALVTTHLAIKDIAGAITKEKIIEKATIFSRSLRRDFRISTPRIAILSLNPHCGDGGLLGTEEEEVIIPAIKELSESGIYTFRPFAADGFFGRGTYESFDGVLAMYHDQGLAPFKALDTGSGVNYTAGLPLVRTSPEHGTAYEIAGKGEADEESFRHAIFFALDVFRNRVNYDEPFADPLPKLYHEKKEEGERPRLPFPKKNTEAQECKPEQEA